MPERRSPRTILVAVAVAIAVLGGGSWLVFQRSGPGPASNAGATATPPTVSPAAPIQKLTLDLRRVVGEPRLREPRAARSAPARGPGGPPGHDRVVLDGLRRPGRVAGGPLPDARPPLHGAHTVARPSRPRRADPRSAVPPDRHGPAGNVDDRRAVPGRSTSARRGRVGEVPRDGGGRPRRAPDPALGLLHVASRRRSLADRVVRGAEPGALDPRPRREGPEGSRLSRPRVDGHVFHPGDRERRAAGRIAGGHTRRFAPYRRREPRERGDLDPRDPQGFVRPHPRRRDAEDQRSPARRTGPGGDGPWSD